MDFNIEFSFSKCGDFESDGADLEEDLYEALGNYEWNCKTEDVSVDSVECMRCNEFLWLPEYCTVENLETLICPNCDVAEASKTP